MKHLLAIIVLFMLLLTACNPSPDEVTVYCTVDQVFSEPVLKDFEKETGIKVKAVYDTEETKSTGVMNRLIAEKDNPQCDVFWSGDPVRNSVLQSRDITEPYQSEQTRLIPDHFKEKNNHWIGFSARARVLIYNKNLIASDSLPQSVFDFTNPSYKGGFAIANPLFGTTTFHMAALFVAHGDAQAKQWMNDIKANGVVVTASNGDVKKQVMNGELAFGLTDTDDAFEAKKESDAVDYIFLDQQENGIGTLIMPNALSLIKGSPNSENGKKLMDYLLTRETETKLAKSCAQMPLIKGTEVPENVPSLDNINPMKVDFKETSDKLEAIQSWLKEWTLQ
ncbi:extracellular solute-binding protein [Algoriphagus sp. AGSA1]|uniref:extracellular solute-binding protein n=1 Tax=unclassified Algoriphagus TaxID=2641541 RepID=UPI00177EB50C|nr:MULTISPECIES: extracellular solute-binding protein [unclassified Algoriphagus]MCE7056231.1 extracellular solute-binding protein [Algoriphagus sp. AGSA1]